MPPMDMQHEGGRVMTSRLSRVLEGLRAPGRIATGSHGTVRTRLHI